MSASRALRLALAAIASLALAACYGSDRQLLDTARAARPLALGDVRVGDAKPGDADDARPVRVEALAGGVYRISPRDEGDRDEPVDLVFTPLAPGAAAYAVSMQAPREAGVIYGIGRRRGARIILTFPFCEGEARTRAVAVGATVTAPASQPECVFAARAPLMRALTAFAAATPPRPEDFELPAAAISAP